MSKTDTEKLTEQEAEQYALEDAGRVVRSLAISGDLELEWGSEDELLIRKAMCGVAAELKKRAGLQVCRECACDDDDACVLPDGRRCGWFEPDLCSACAELAETRPLIEVASR